MWQAGWEGSLGESGYMYVWLSPFSVRLNYHNIVNRLYPNTKVKGKKIKRIMEEPVTRPGGGHLNTIVSVICCSVGELSAEAGQFALVKARFRREHGTMRRVQLQSQTSLDLGFCSGTF